MTAKNRDQRLHGTLIQRLFLAAGGLRLFNRHGAISESGRASPDSGGEDSE